MREGLPGEERLVRWAHQQAYESRLRPRLHALETARSLRQRRHSSTACSRCSRCAGSRIAARRCARWPPASVAWIVSDIAKLVVERPRPCLHQLSCGTHSFPEGPGMVLVAVAVAIWPRSRAIAVVAVVCALADAVVQLGYGSHWPSDLLGAWLLGGACGFASRASPASRARSPPAGE